MQLGVKTWPRRGQDASKTFQDGSKTLQDGSKTIPGGSKTAKSAPRAASLASKIQMRFDPKMIVSWLQKYLKINLWANMVRSQKKYYCFKNVSNRYQK